MTNGEQGTDYLALNRALWNAWTLHHLDSDHHADVARFRAGGLTVRSIERELLGDVRGRSLLHLQCNMGSDTLSWARLGARVMGIDSADAAIEQARALATEAALPARFLCSDLYALPTMLEEQFDTVFTSYGALCWLPDLARWAEIVARYLRPGGTFALVEMHPYAMMLNLVEASGPIFRTHGSYFHTQEPLAEVTSGLPDAVAADAPASVYIWRYSLGEVVTALIQAGLRLDLLQEFPLAFYQQFPTLVRDDDGWWRWPAPDITIPMLFAIRATKPEE